MQLRILLGVMITLGLLAAGWVFVNPRLLAEWLDVGGPPVQADYLLVLSGDHNGRPFRAAELFSAGQATTLLITRPLPRAPLYEQTVPDHETSRAVLRRLGVPAEQIVVLEGPVDSTFDEARAARDFLADRPDARLAVVTSFFHTRRARWIFSQLFGDRMDRVSFVSAPYCDVTAGNWWQSEDAFVAVLSEYLKFGYYGLRYSSWWRWFVGLGVGVSLLVINRRSCCSLFAGLRDRLTMKDRPLPVSDGSISAAPRVLCWSLVAGLACGCWYWRAPLLQGLACGLTTAAEAKDVDYIVIRSPDGLRPSVDQCYDAAGSLYAEGRSRRIVLLSARQCPVVRIGAALSFFALSERELAARGVSTEAILRLETDATTRTAETTALGRWLRQQTASESGRCLFLCNSFDARSWRYLFDRAMPSPAAERIEVFGLSHRGIDQSNWWHSRHGLTATFGSFAKLAYCYFHRERRSG